MSDLGSIFLLSLLAMFTPTLLAAVTVMMLLPNPKRLMLGYLLGAYLTSITAGLLIDAIGGGVTLATIGLALAATSGLFVLSRPLRDASAASR